MSDWGGLVSHKRAKNQEQSVRAQHTGREGVLNPKHETREDILSSALCFCLALTLALNSEKRERNQVNDVG